MGINGVNHITLAVHDLAVARAFYETILGAHCAAHWADGAYLELGSLWLCLERSDAVTPRADDSHIALSCQAAEFDMLSTRIAAAAPLWKSNISEGASLYFLDPDGHKLELHVGNLASRLAQYETRKDVTLPRQT